MTRPGPESSRRGPLSVLLLAFGLALAAPAAQADAFARARYDAAADSLVVTLLYRGTNPDHRFTLRWGACDALGAGEVSEIAAEVLDSQWDDAALHDYRKTVRFSLAGLPCRPAKVTLRTAPRFIYNVYVPARKPGT